MLLYETCYDDIRNGYLDKVDPIQSLVNTTKSTYCNIQFSICFGEGGANLIAHIVIYQVDSY